MRYLEFKLIGEETIGIDELGNHITKELVLGTGKGRFTEWSSEEITLNGIDYTVVNRKLLTTVPFDLLKTAIYIETLYDTYEITALKELSNRFRLVHMKWWHL